MSPATLPRAAGWTGRPCPGCNRGIPPGRYACAACWRRLPAGLRLAVTRAWGRRTRGAEGATAEHEAAKAAADAWLAERRGGQA